MIRKIATAGGVLLSILSFVGSAWAVSSSLWEQNSKTAFEAGEPDGVSIMAPGKILLSPKAQEININARYSWSLAEDGNGRLFAATGSDGVIFLVTESAVENFADLDLQQIFALTIDKKGTLYAGGFPGGKIYTLSPKGDVSEYFDTGEAAVWALHLKDDGTLIAGTGNDGRLYTIKPGGTGEILYDSRERRLLSLIGDKEGNIYAGSDQNGIIYKFNHKNEVSVFYDTELEEVTAMALDKNGDLFAVSAPGDLFMKMQPPQAAPIISKAMEAAFAGMDMSMGGAPDGNGQPAPPLPEMPAIPTAKKRSCIVYKIDEKGAASKFWVSPDNLIFSLAVAGENLLAGSGDEGIIYIISPTGEAGTFYKSDQKQVLALHHSPDGSLVAGLGNDAAIVRFQGVYSPTGTYFSQVHDTKAVSKWGRIFWEADVPKGTQILISTRSGNSQTPDNTWSDWAPENGSAKYLVSPSPAARYIQWRAVLKTSDPYETPVLSELTVAYLQSNLPPKVQSLTMGGGAANNKEVAGPPDMAAVMKAMAGAACPPTDEDENEKVKTTAEGVKSAPPTHEEKLKVQWQAKDENDDKLQYELFFKGTEEQKWKLLKKELKESNYEWNTQAVPDGDYQVKVVASDRLSNPIGVALQGEKISDIFTIDNTSPSVNGLKTAPVPSSARYRVEAMVVDNMSPVSAAHYSVDAGEWIPIFPMDGIFDSLTEKVEFETEELEDGEHTVAVKVVDYFGNVGAGKITFLAQ